MKQTLLMMTALSLGVTQANATLQAGDANTEVETNEVIIENNALTLSEVINASEDEANPVNFVPQSQESYHQPVKVDTVKVTADRQKATENLAVAEVQLQTSTLSPNDSVIKPVALTVTHSPSADTSDIQLPVISKTEVATLETQADSIEVVESVVDSQPITDAEIDDAINHLKTLNKQANKKDKELSQLVKELTVKTEEQKKAALAELEAARAAKARADKLAAEMAAEAARKKKLALEKQKQQAKAKQLAKAKPFVASNRAVSRKSAPALAASRASRAALSRSIGLCAKYVRVALQSAGYRFTPNPSAYQYATRGTLAKAGFVKISNASRPQVGDVVVFHRTKKNPHGHIQIFDGKRWVSDFRQRTKNPYRGVRSYTTWRDKRYLNNAAVKGTYLAMK